MAEVENDRDTRMLLVEDDLDSGQALSALLRKSGIEVTLVASAEEVIGKLNVQDFDVLVADIRLGGMSGIGLLKHVRDDAPHFPVILITGYDSLESAIEAVRLGAQDYILKPLDSIDDLLVPVRRAVRNHRLLLRNRKLEKDLERRCAELRELGVRLGESEEAERRRICRDLHDSVGPVLTSLGINLDVALAEFEDGQNDEGLVRMGIARKQAEDMADSLRRVMYDLYPSVLDDCGLSAALRWYAEEFEETAGIPVRADVPDLSERLPNSVETTLFRVAQEALTNALKHSQAQNVSVLLEETGPMVKLVIDDDGRGFDPAVARSANGGWGLLFMRERTESVAGSFEVISSPGKGTSVVISIGRGCDGDQGDTD